MAVDNSIMLACRRGSQAVAFILKRTTVQLGIRRYGILRDTTYAELNDLFDRLTGHQDGSMRMRETFFFVVISQHAQDGAIVEAETR
jgi:hypothetical protein